MCSPKASASGDLHGARACYRRHALLALCRHALLRHALLRHALKGACQGGTKACASCRGRASLGMRSLLRIIARSAGRGRPRNALPCRLVHCTSSYITFRNGVYCCALSYYYTFHRSYIIIHFIFITLLSYDTIPISYRNDLHNTGPPEAQVEDAPEPTVGAPHMCIYHIVEPISTL